VKKLLWLLVLVALALPVTAAIVNRDVAITDGSGRVVSDGTFVTIGGVRADPDSLLLSVDQDTLNWQTVDLPGMPGTFNFQIAEETNCASLKFSFKVSDQGLTAGYAWGDTFTYYVGGTYKRDYFQIGAYDQFKVGAVGTDVDPNPTVEFFYWVEGK